MIKIEKGVELPDKSSGRPPKYPFAQLEVGDSFLADKKVQTTLGGYRRRHPEKKFVTRKVTEDKVRVWRTQ